MASLLRSAGLKFRTHVRRLPGSPDFVLSGAKVAVFADGSWWHGRSFDQTKHKLKPFWRDKISGNMRRDKRVDARLRRMGYSVVRAWDEDIEKRPGWCLKRVLRARKRRLER